MDPNVPPTPPTPPTPPNPPGPGDAVQRPEWLPEAHWDQDASSIKPEFGAHYAELTSFHKTATERDAALKARKPEDIKLEVKLPETVKVPDGFQIKIDEKDPRVPLLREVAIARNLDQDAIDDLVAIDAQMKIAAHAQEVERVKAEDAKLGANGPQRKEAITNWAKGLLDAKKITADEHDELRMTAATAAGVSLIEKLMAQASGSVAGHEPTPPPKAPEPTVTDRWYGGQQKVS
jgi:hypothetical protein